MTDFRALLADDAFAASFQSLGQYRTALLAALAQPEPQGPTGRPAIEPVPVVERLPGAEDCDAEGRCFVWDWLATEWRFLERNIFEYGWEDAYWLPHHALPVPQQEADRD